jgi:hypothetical protein
VEVRTDPDVFSEEIFDTQRLTVAPLVILFGFAIEVAAILYKPKSEVRHGLDWTRSSSPL